VDPFDDCVAKGRLKKIEPDAERVAKELDTAREELERARSCYLGGNWDEAATQAYFALYRCARAAVNSKGYRDTNLFGLCAAVQKLFVDADELPRDTVRQIRDGKDVKDAVYDGHRANRGQARTLLQDALVIGKTVFTRLALPGFDAGEIETTIPEPADPPRERSPRRPPRPGRGGDWSPPRR